MNTRQNLKLLFFNVDSKKIKITSSKKDTLINGINYPKSWLSIPLGNRKMNPYYSEAFSNAFQYANLESDADFFHLITKTILH